MADKAYLRPVRNTLKYLLKAIIVTLYCFLVSVCSGHFAHPLRHVCIDSEAAFHATTLSGAQLFHHHTSSFSIGVAVQSSSSSPSNPFHAVLSAGSELWPIHSNPLTRFRFWSQRLIIHFIKEDIIYPFHDFW